MAKPKPKPHQSVAVRARHDRAFLKKALANPGLRAKLPSSMLPANLRQQRETNTRLATPIVPGSSMTEGGLANAAQAATTTRYGPQERSLTEQQGIAQQTQRDTGSFYDQYLKDLAQHAANVAGFQQGAQQGMAQVAQGITGLAGSQGAALQQQANQTAVPGVAPAGNLGPTASDAASVQQQMIAAFQAQQAQTGAADSSYADAQARVVGPGQKLAAQAQAAGRTRDVGKQIQSLRDEEGAFNQQFRDTRRQDEFKNVLAQQTLGANVAQDQTQAAIAATNAQTAQTRVSETVKHNRTQEQIAKDRNKNAAKTAQQKADLAAGKVNQYGYTDAAWRAMSTAQRQKVIKDFKAKSGKGKDQSGKGPSWKTSNEQSTGRSQVVSLRDYANKAKAGQAFVAGHARQPPMSRAQAAQKIKQSVAAPADPILLTAALDAAYDGRLSRATVRALIAAGYKPSLIASALHVGTGPTPRRPRSTGSVVPGVGSTVAQS
jgi:hypothetical protein